jgi:tripartite-type tricarboxylate transporter receptor subunit TctC
VNRRDTLRLLAGAAASPFAARAQPSRTARIVVGVPAGAPGDLLARAVAEKIRGSLAETVIVENLPGASTQLAIGAAVRSAPDGSTLLLTPSSPLSVFPFTYSRLPYRPSADLLPVSLAGHFNHAFAVGPAVPPQVGTLKDFLNWAKANPDKATCGTSGSGTIPHLLSVLLARQAGVPLINVPYKGSGPGVIDLLGGQISSMSSPIGNFLPHAAGGKLRMLAVSGEARSRLAPSVPTYRELGHQLVAREWLGFFFPAATPEAIVQRASRALSGALSAPEVAATVSGLGIEVAASAPEELARMLQADAEEWQGIIRQIGFKADS